MPRIHEPFFAQDGRIERAAAWQPNAVRRIGAAPMANMGGAAARMSRAQTQAQALEGRVILFLQGMPGPFFSHLGKAASEAGAIVRRINFNGGDVVDWQCGGAIAYRGRARDWPEFLAAQLSKDGVTDLILFGDCRAYHQVAIALAAQHNIRIFVVEEGYLRPNFVTFARNGVNARAQMPGSLEDLRAACQRLTHTEQPVQEIEGSFKTRALETYRYYVATYLSAPFFPFFATHRVYPPILEGLYWLWRLAYRKAERRRAQFAAQRLKNVRYFLFPLQLDNDVQLRVHSAFGAMGPALDHVLSSFARGADGRDVLAIKLHPLDCGIVNWRKIVARRAAHYGLQDRCVFLEDGDINELILGACGLVTVNSTSGSLALALGIPVRALGEAVYNLEGVTSQLPLDAFWRDPGTVDAQNFEALKRVLMAEHLVNGGFHTPMALELLVKGAMARLIAAGQLPSSADGPAAHSLSHTAMMGAS